MVLKLLSLSSVQRTGGGGTGRTQALELMLHLNPHLFLQPEQPCLTSHIGHLFKRKTYWSLQALMYSFNNTYITLTKSFTPKIRKA